MSPTEADRIADPPEARSAAADSRVLRAVEEYLAALEAGAAPGRAEFVSRYPDIAACLEVYLGGLDLIHRAGSAAGALAEGDDSADERSGVEPVGDFLLLRELGRGGMGVVYEAVQRSLNRKVALKVLPFAAALDGRQLQRFKNEAQAAAGLHHPHIVPVHAVGCERGVHYYAMQLIEGQTLAALIAGLCQPGGRPLAVGQRQHSDGSPTCEAPAETARAQMESTLRSFWPKADSRKPAAEFYRTVAHLGIQSAEALEYAHQMGIVHRDIKPANLLVEGEMAHGRAGASARPPSLARRCADAPVHVWITDFGLAHVQNESTRLTLTGDLLGTLRYMSPEQALANRVVVDHRTDIYSLGVTLYELLVLQPAFDGKDRQEILRQIAFDEPKPPRRLRPNIPAELQTIILKAMEKRPEDRYVSAGEMAQDLRRWLEDRPIRARRPGLIQRGRKWGRRHKPLLAAAAIGLILALMGVTTGAVIGMLQAREAAETERQARTTAQRSEADSKAVLDFVENRILAAARPEGHEGGLGSEVTLRKALQAALPHVDESFKGQPLIEARLRRTMGLSFRYLGDEPTAAAQFELARKLYAGQLGASAPETLAATNNLANSYAALGRHDEALHLRQETLRLRQAELGPDHEQTIDSLSNLALSYQAAGKHEDALRLHEEALARRTAQFGLIHPHTLASTNNVGISYTLLGRHAEAIKLREETLTLVRDRFGLEHPNTLACMNNLAESCQAVGRFADALALYEKTLALAKLELTENHPNTLLVMNNLAWLLATADDARFRAPARAVALAEKAAQASPRTAEYWGTLGTARHRAGDCKHAVADLEKALALRGPENPMNANESFFLAMACRQLGDTAAARKWFDKGVAWMDGGPSRKDEVRRFRAEAAGLLGIKE